MIQSDRGREDGFLLDPRLAADTRFVQDLPLSRVLLMNDDRYPWLILVPRVAGISELHQLSGDDRSQLTEEVSAASACLSDIFDTDKINIGALGNIVSQLHVHVVARRKSDSAWPGPVWGQGTAVEYDQEDTGKLIQKIKKALGAATIRL